MSIGFTGTREEITAEQRSSLSLLLMIIKEYDNRFHHGDCVGADATAHDIACELGFIITVHPPIENNKRAFCKAEMICESKTHLERNTDIVDSCYALIAVPRTDKEEIRSGTWATVRYAREVRKVIFIIMPNGDIKKELKKCM